MGTGYTDADGDQIGSGDDSLIGGSGDDVITGDNSANNLITNGDFGASGTGWTANAPNGMNNAQITANIVQFNSQNETIYGQSIAQDFTASIGLEHTVSLDLRELGRDRKTIPSRSVFSMMQGRSSRHRPIRLQKIHPSQSTSPLCPQPTARRCALQIHRLRARSVRTALMITCPPSRRIRGWSGIPSTAVRTMTR